MALKRKRSASELFSSPSPSSDSSSPSSFFGSPPMQNAVMLSFSSPRAALAQPAHLPSRTLKRFRDGRPSEVEVHERTLGLLYSAQQRGTPQLSSRMEEEPITQVTTSSTATRSQQSLHRFWNIASAPVPIDNIQLATVHSTASACEDCGAGLTEDDGQGDGMDIDGLGSEDAVCGACGKHVCFSCSVSNLGEQKRCLQCAGRRVWVGGIGWTSQAQVC